LGHGTGYGGALGVPCFSQFIVCGPNRCVCLSWRFGQGRGVIDDFPVFEHTPVFDALFLEKNVYSVARRWMRRG